MINNASIKKELNILVIDTNPHGDNRTEDKKKTIFWP